MAIKMRVLYASGKAKIAAMAALIQSEYGLAINAVDKIPPAYSCDKERLVILMLSLKGTPDDQLRLFCRELNKGRAQNVALIVDGSESAAAQIKSILTEAGTHVADEILYVKGGLPFLKGIKEEEKAALLAFTHRIVDQIQ